MQEWRCFACGARERGRTRPARCWCGVENSWEEAGSDALDGAKPGRPTAEPAVCLGELESSELERAPSGNSALDRVLGGGFALGYTALVHGPPGAGKSRAVYRWASRLAPSLLVATEMPAELTQHTARDCGADPGALYYFGSANGWRAEAERVRARSVVVDSISETRSPARVLAELREWVEGTARFGWAIAHENKRGRSFGSAKQEYRPDYVLRLTRGRKGSARVQVRKSRFCGPGVAAQPLVRPG